jgi:hypothetical protein
MRPRFATVGPLAAASATNIRTASAIAGAGAVVLNGATVTNGVATLDNPRRVLFTFAAGETLTLTLTGTRWDGQTVSETIATGAATPGTVSSVLDYKTVTSVVSSAASNGNVSIGTSTVAGSSWINFDWWLSDGVVAFQVDVTGTANYTVQQTLDDPNNSTTPNDPGLSAPTPGNPMLPANVQWVNCSDTTMVNATVTAQSNYNFAPIWMRVVLNSGSGSVALTALQHGGS